MSTEQDNAAHAAMADSADTALTRERGRATRGAPTTGSGVPDNFAVRIARANYVKSTEVATATEIWRDIAAGLVTEPVRRNVTMAKYCQTEPIPHREGDSPARHEALTKKNRRRKQMRDDLKCTAIYIGAAFKSVNPDGSSPRKKQHVEARTLFTMDIDHGVPDAFVSDLLAGTGLLAGVEYAFHTTMSSRPDDQRLRLVLPIQQEIPVVVHDSAVRGLAALVESAYPGVIVDAASFDAARALFKPALTSDAPHTAAWHRGCFLDVAALADIAKQRKVGHQQASATTRALKNHDSNAAEIVARWQEIFAAEGWCYEIVNGGWITRCQHHRPDTNPSCHIFPDGGFKCWGCGWHGSVIDHVMAAYGENEHKAMCRAEKHLGLISKAKKDGGGASPVSSVLDPASKTEPEGGGASDVACVLELAAKAATEPELLKELVKQCKGLPHLVYNQMRKAVATAAGLGVTALDSEVMCAKRAEEPTCAKLLDVEPSAEDVDGDELLSEMTAFLAQFIDAPARNVDVLALFALFAHVLDAFSIAPRLFVSSPQPGCGKTLVLELLSLLVQRPLVASSISDALLPRVIEKHHPTLILDELDTFNLRERPALAGVLNGGHKRGAAFAWKTTGDNHEPTPFSIWAPYIFGGIGRAGMTDAAFSRCINVQLQKMRPGTKLKRLFRSDERHAATLASKAAKWALSNMDALRDLDEIDDPALDWLPSHRAMDNWRPLLAIAKAAGGKWPKRTLAAARSLTATAAEPEAAATLLLADLKILFEGADYRTTKYILAVLAGDDFAERPWREWKKGRGLKAADLGNMLAPYGVVSKNVGTKMAQAKGYKAADFADVFERYIERLPEPPPAEPSTVHQQENKPETVDGTFPPNVRPSTGSKNSYERWTAGDEPAFLAETGEPRPEHRETSGGSSGQTKRPPSEGNFARGGRVDGTPQTAVRHFQPEKQEVDGGRHYPGGSGDLFAETQAPIPDADRPQLAKFRAEQAAKRAANLDEPSDSDSEQPPHRPGRLA